MTDLDKTIADLQRRIAIRGLDIADLEFIYNIRRSVAYTHRQYRFVRAVREEIKPLALQQKQDRQILRELTNKRTSERRNNQEPSYVPLFSLIETIRVGDLLKSNKFSFPG